MNDNEGDRATHQSRARFGREAAFLAFQFLEPGDPLYGRIRESLMCDAGFLNDFADMSLADLIDEVINYIR